MKTSMTTGQMAKFLELLEQKGVTPELFQQRLSNGVLADIFDTSATFQDRSKWRKAFGLSKLALDQIILSVDYSKSLDQMIEDGNYDWVNKDITSSWLKISGEGVTEMEAKLFHFGTGISSEEAKRHIEEAGWELARTEHILAFGATFPEEQREYSIIALGAVCKVSGLRQVMCLGRGGSGRNLGINWWASGWSSVCYFLAVRKVTRDSVS